MLAMSAQVSGPLFASGAGRVMAEGVSDVEQRLAEAALREWQVQLYPGHGVETGAYRRSLHVVRKSPHEVVDDGSVKGPWLEAGGRGTRFKGYAAARRATQQAERAAGRIANDEIGRTVRRLS